MKTEVLAKLGLKSLTQRPPGADDPGRIAELEELAGHPLPADYREFILHHAPAHIGPVLFRAIEPCPWAENDLMRMNVFYGLDRSSTKDLLSHNEDREFPEGMITIGYDPGGNDILLDLKEPAGRVYFHDRDSDQIFLCANTFTDFLASFEDDPDEK